MSLFRSDVSVLENLVCVGAVGFVILLALTPLLLVLTTDGDIFATRADRAQKQDRPWLAEGTTNYKDIGKRWHSFCLDANGILAHGDPNLSYTMTKVHDCNEGCKTEGETK